MIFQPSFSITEVLAVASALWLVYQGISRLRARSFKFTSLQGPPRPNLFFGLSKAINDADDSAGMYEQWSIEYGHIFQLPMALGSTRIILTDPKAIAHFYARENTSYVKTALSSRFIENLLGRGLLWAQGENHRRQRKALSPAFSNVAIRNLTSVFFDSAYQTKAAWDSILESSPSNDAVINVQEWMNHISLDSVGIAGFSHDFGTLKGRQSSVADAFDAFNDGNRDFWFGMTIMLGPVIPMITSLPTTRNKLNARLKRTMGVIADELLQRTREERKGAVERIVDRSVIGLLIKAENAASGNRISEEEVLAQMNVLILAGYETTSISLTWALIELSRRPELQERLREELSAFQGVDPTWDELTHSLPFLDAVVHEVLRLHPPVQETMRQAAEDDIIPLSSSIVTADGNTVSSITVRKGQMVAVPIHCVNRMEALWGADAKEFKPERWLNGGVDRAGLGARGIQGHHHLLTFIDGPRTCIGKNFALAEFKAVLSVLVRNYAFELPEGADMKIELHRAILPRPTIKEGKGTTMPLRVRRVE